MQIEAVKYDLSKVDAVTRQLYLQSLNKRGRKTIEELAAIEKVTGKPYTPRFPQASKKKKKVADTQWVPAKAVKADKVSADVPAERGFTDLVRFLRLFDVSAPMTISQGHMKVKLSPEVAKAALVAAGQRDIADKRTDAALSALLKAI